MCVWILCFASYSCLHGTGGGDYISRCRGDQHRTTLEYSVSERVSGERGGYGI